MLDLAWRCGRLVERFARYSGARGVVAACAVGLAAALEGMGILLLIPLLVLVTRSGGAGRGLTGKFERLFDAALDPDPWRRLMVLMALFAGLMIFRAILVSARDRMLATLRTGFVEHLRVTLARRLTGARWTSVAPMRRAQINHIMNTEIERCGSGVQFLVQVSISVVMLTGAASVAFLLSWRLAAMAIAILCVGGLMLAPLLARSRDLGQMFDQASVALADVTGGFLSGLKLALSENLQDRFVAQFETASAELQHRQMSFARQDSALNVASTAIVAAVGGVVVVVGIGFLHVAPPVLIALLLALTRMTGPAMEIQLGAVHLVHILPAFDHVMALEAELPPRSPENADLPGLTPVGSIVFDAVSFLHAGGRGVRDIDLNIGAGEFVGVRGPSGAGKTTLADLLVGLLSPDQGVISVGGAPLCGGALVGWRGTLAYVSQDPFLFHDTVRRNLTWATPEVDEGDLWRALRSAGADELVRGMTFGLDTIVGDRGTLVSGGERQRLALARALLRRPSLLVLDEATNAVDLVSEHALLESIAALRPRPTVVMIAHRPESLALCDRIIDLEDGRLVSRRFGPRPQLDRLALGRA